MFIFFVPLLVALIVVGRMSWRILRHNEEMEPGGSYGRQMTRRTKKDRTVRS